MTSNSFYKLRITFLIGYLFKCPTLCSSQRLMHTTSRILFDYPELNSKNCSTDQLALIPSSTTTGVIAFKAMLQELVRDYNEKGPMVPGVAPTEASERLFIFQGRFDEGWRKYVTYSGGEELFGLSVNEYPELMKIKVRWNIWR